MIEFQHTVWFFGLVLIPIYLWYEFKIKNRKRARLPYPRLDVLRSLKIGKDWKYYVPFVIRSLIILLLITALAKPRWSIKRSDIETNGVDIVFAMDLSGTMKALDYKPVNRLEAAKKVALDFIKKRQNDRIGIVTFSEFAYTQSPLTLDYNILEHIIKNISINEKYQLTAIGMGISCAVSRLQKSKAKSKVIILMTDGINNYGEIDPLSAAEMAQKLGIKVYCIAIGSSGMVEIPVNDSYLGVRYEFHKLPVDMATLNKIAIKTGSNYARMSQNTHELQEIMIQIDAMEKTKTEIKNYYEYRELFQYLLALVLLLFMIEFIFRNIIIGELP